MSPRRTLAISTAGVLLALGALLWLLRGEGAAPAVETVRPPIERHEPGPDALPAPAGDAATLAEIAEGPPQTPSDAPIIGTSPVEAEPAAAKGSVNGHVLDQDGVFVASVLVSLYRGATKQQVQTDASGGFAFADLEPGIYRLFVDGRSLPEGYLPPWRQQVPREYDGTPTGIHGTVFRVDDAAPREVDLRVFAAGTVRGRLVDAGGAPQGGALITLRSSSGIESHEISDERGAFEFEDVYPARCSAWAQDAPLSRSDQTLPLHFDVAPRQTVVLADLVSGAGGHVLRGVVSDRAGHPVARLVVACREPGEASVWFALTDENGRFSLARVPSARLAVECGSDERIFGVLALRSGSTTVAVDTRGAPEELDLGTITVEVEPSVFVTGRVEIDAAWAAANELGEWRGRVELRPLDGSASRLLVVLGSRTRGELAVGDFTWSGPLPQPDLEFRVVLQSARGAEFERTSVARSSAGAAHVLVFTFP